MLMKARPDETPDRASGEKPFRSARCSRSPGQRVYRCYPGHLPSPTIWSAPSDGEWALREVHASTHLGRRGICPMSGQRVPLGLDQPLADRVEHGLRAIVDLQLLVHVADVVANGLLADAQPAGDLLVRESGGEQFEDLDFTPGQAVVEL